MSHGPKRPLKIDRRPRIPGVLADAGDAADRSGRAAARQEDAAGSQLEQPLWRLARRRTGTAEGYNSGTDEADGTDEASVGGQMVAAEPWSAIDERITKRYALRILSRETSSPD